jgi:long-chain acyl-CoA synthetase
VKFYDEGVPGSLEYPEQAIPWILQARAEQVPEHIALIQGDRRMTYRQLFEHAERLARELVREGLESGERVAICFPNQIEFVISFYAVLLAGGVVAALNPTFPPRELKFQIEIVRPRILITGPGSAEKIWQAKLETLFKKVFIAREDAEFHIDAVDGNRMIVRQEGQTADKPALPKLSANAPAILQFSGGTTGLPKAAVGLHRNVVANVIQFSRWLTPLNTGDEVFLAVVPLYHVYGMVIALNVALFMGAKVILVNDPRDVQAIVNAISAHRVTAFPGVPSLFHAISQYLTNNPGISLSSIKACISGSAPLPLTVKAKFEELTGARLVEGYGLSEAPTATHCNPFMGQNKSGSIGLPLPDVECRVVDIACGKNLLPAGEEGELLIRGPQIMQGYFEQEVETSIALADGWLHTGDIVRMDNDGYFYIVGRKKEMIKVGGLQVWPGEVEEVVRQMPGVLECAARGVEDEYLGEVVKVWVVASPGAAIDLEQMREFCQEHLASYKIPRHLQLLEQLPRSAVGKVLKYQLI